MHCLPGRGGAPGALTSAGGLSQVVGLAGLRQAVWMRRAAGLLAEVAGRCCVHGRGAPAETRWLPENELRGRRALKQARGSLARG